MKNYLCKEGKEEFVLQADSLEAAKSDAILYNAKVLHEIKITKRHPDGSMDWVKA